jgi:hypothetical protein
VLIVETSIRGALHLPKPASLYLSLVDVLPA